MFKSSLFANNRRIGCYFITNQFSKLKKDGAHITAGPASCLCKFYSMYRCSSRRYTSFTLYKAKETSYRTYAEHSLFYSKCDTMTHHAQITWKRFSQICGSAFSPLRRIVSFIRSSLTYSYPVAYGIFALMIGKAEQIQMAWAEAVESLPKGNNLYMHAQNKHVHMTSFIFSVFEGCVLLVRTIGRSLYVHAQDGHIYLTSFIFSIFESFILVMRAIYLAILFSPTIAILPFADSFGFQFRRTCLCLVHATLEKAGPAFIKWGQWAATRPDLFPEDLCIELSKLHTKAPEHCFAYTKTTIEKAFGRKLCEIFDDFDEGPVASGSVAQVHRATLRFQYPGKPLKPIEVAVKVRHPGVIESIRKDNMIITIVANVLNFIPALKWLRLDESVHQFSVCMMSQVDLTREAAQLNRFISNFHKFKDVSFPQPLMVHPAVLVETYEEGVSVSHYIDGDDDLKGNHRTKQALADIGTRALLKMLLEDNFIHADLHPGNILVRVAQGKPHVIFLDVGMTTELSRADQVNLLEFFKAVADRDGRTVAECTLKLSKQQTCPNPKAFIEEVEKSFTLWSAKEGKDLHPAECVHQLLENVRHHKVNVDGNVCAVMVTTSVHEDWQRKLDPDYNAMKTLQTLFRKADWAESLVYTLLAVMAP